MTNWLDAHDLGFTGTRQHINPWQQYMLDQLLRYHRLLGFRRFHHGDCVGADAYAAMVAAQFGYYVIAHPPIDPKLRAYAHSHEIRDPKPYHNRNADIVSESDVGIVVPHTEVVVSHSGTWSTYAKMHAAELPCWVITPSSCWVPVLGVPAEAARL